MMIGSMAFALKKCSACFTYWPQSSLPSSKAPTLPSSCTCSVHMGQESHLRRQICVVTTSIAVPRLNNVHKLLGSNTRASMLTYKNLSHHAAVKISIHTGNTKLHISNNTRKTSLQHTGLFKVTQYTISMDTFVQVKKFRMMHSILTEYSSWLHMETSPIPTTTGLTTVYVTFYFHLSNI